MKKFSLSYLFLNIAVAWACVKAVSAKGYTYDAGGATLKPNDQGIVTFYLNEEDIPQFYEIESFEDGKYLGLGDTQIYYEITQRALDLWNAVPGKSISLKRAFKANAKQDTKNLLHTVSFGELQLNAGASARPKVGNQGKNIVDCDITIPEQSTLSYFAVAFAHEVGHCLGLGHEHKDLYALMSYNFSSFRVTLDDAAGFVSLYPEHSTGANKNFVPCGAIPGLSQPSSLYVASGHQKFSSYVLTKQKNSLHVFLILALLCLPLLIALQKRSSKNPPK